MPTFFDDTDYPQSVLVLTSHQGQVYGNSIKFDENGITNIAFQIDDIESHAQMMSEPEGNLVQFHEGFNREKYNDYQEPPK